MSFELDFFGETPAADWADIGLLVLLSVLVDPVEPQPLLAFEVLPKIEAWSLAYLTVNLVLAPTK